MARKAALTNRVRAAMASKVLASGRCSKEIGHARSAVPPSQNFRLNQTAPARFTAETAIAIAEDQGHRAVHEDDFNFQLIASLGQKSLPRIAGEGFCFLWFE